MAKLKKKPIILAPSVKLEFKEGTLTVSGAKGSLTLNIPVSLHPVISENLLTLNFQKNEKNIPLMGLYYSLIGNAVKGVEVGWNKTLEMVGVGFRAQTDGKKLILSIGFSHPVEIMAPNGITFKVDENRITVGGVDKYLVGEVSARIRKVKSPEPYKGKGIKYLGEKIRKKAGKAAKAVGGTITK